MPGEPTRALPPGICEELLTSELERNLEQLLDRYDAAHLDPEEAADRLAMHTAALVHRTVASHRQDRRALLADDALPRLRGSRNLVQWESQSTTGADSPTGRRYQQHATLGSQVLLFARRTHQMRAFWFLGPARYVSHEGQRPMAVTWRLTTALPGDLYAQFAATAVA